SPLELQTSFARAVGERLDTSVIQVAAPVEDDRLDADLLGRLGNGDADRAGLVGLVAAEPLDRDPARAGERLAARVVDELREHAAVGTEDREPRPLRGSGDLAAHATMTALACLARRELAHCEPPAPLPAPAHRLLATP